MPFRATTAVALCLLAVVGLALEVALLHASGGQIPPPKVTQPQTKMALLLPRPPAANEAVTVDVTVGTLPDGASIIVRTESGEIAGTVSPFGLRARRSGGVYTIPIPAGAHRDGALALTLEIKQKDGTTRTPDKSEVTGTKVTLVPVSRR